MEKRSVFLSLFFIIGLITSCQSNVSSISRPTPSITPSAIISSSVNSLSKVIATPMPFKIIEITAPNVGSSTDIKFKNSLWNTPKTGSKWVYTAKLNNFDLGLFSVDVTSSDIKTFTAKITFLNLPTDKVIEYEKIGDFFSNPFGSTITPTEKTDYSMIYNGQETINVPSGNYPNAYKITESYKEKNNLGKLDTTVKREWFVKGIGIVKAESITTVESGASNSSITELKEFKS